MTLLAMRHDFRVPADGSSTHAEIYAAAMDQFRWADAHGFSLAVVSEHHGMPDGWLSAPLTAAAAVVGATTDIRVFLSAVLLPLHDPIRIAEQLVVLDHLSRGRVWTVLGAGYRPEEFAMAGVDVTRRGRILEDRIRVLLDAFTGEPFTYEGREVVVTPKSFTDPHPPILVGGGVEAAARRAARLRLPMMPMHGDPQLEEWYRDEAAKTGFEGGYVMRPSGPTFVHVAHDPDAVWAEIGRYVLDEAQTYAAIQTGGQHSAPMVDAATLDELRASPQVLVGTPDDIVAAAAQLAPGGALTFNPLAGGLPPALAWESLELFAAEVLPRLGGGAPA
jgi:alkanesulfonate monooxygenase SsuD/methylene tetrahydromethanopterin reductase-like flavin-dependent oxidoreductase (luciferase family)